MLQATTTLVERRTVGPGQELTLSAPALAQQLGPGQAVLVRAGWELHPYLRRTFHPIAIVPPHLVLRVPPSNDWGHAWLRAAPLGAEIDCLGPVGLGFTVAAGVHNLLCVGEGEAAWSLLPLIQWADSAGLAVTLAAAARAARDALPAARLPASVEYHLVTTESRANTLKSLLSNLSDLLPWADAVAIAGTLALHAPLADTIRAARYALPRGFAQALYPATFLCGRGACQSCVADVAGGRRRVCMRGPVFDLVDVL